MGELTMRISGRLAILTLSAGVLSGCAALQQDAPPDPLAVAVRSCLAGTKQFVDAWGCVQGKDIDDQLGSDPARRNQIMKLGDDLAAQVSAKKLSNAAAVKRLGDGLTVGAPS